MNNKYDCFNCEHYNSKTDTCGYLPCYNRLGSPPSQWKKKKNFISKYMPDFFLGRFRWYRKYRGGTWYHVRVIWDLSRNMSCFWINSEPLPDEYVLRTEKW